MLKNAFLACFFIAVLGPCWGVAKKGGSLKKSRISSTLRQWRRYSGWSRLNVAAQQLCLTTQPNSTTERNIYVQGRRMPGELKKLGDYWFDQDMHRALTELRQQAKKQHIQLRFRSGYRSLAEQCVLALEHASKKRRTPVALPGYSLHQSGLAVDFDLMRDDPKKNRKIIKFLKENASALSLRRTVKNELWHYEYQPSASIALTSSPSKKMYGQGRRVLGRVFGRKNKKALG